MNTFKNRMLGNGTRPWNRRKNKKKGEKKEPSEHWSVAGIARSWHIKYDLPNVGMDLCAGPKRNDAVPEHRHSGIFQNESLGNRRGVGGGKHPEKKGRAETGLTPSHPACCSTLLDNQTPFRTQQRRGQHLPAACLFVDEFSLSFLLGALSYLILKGAHHEGDSMFLSSQGMKGLHGLDIGFDSTKGPVWARQPLVSCRYFCSQRLTFSNCWIFIFPNACLALVVVLLFSGF